MSDKSSIIIEKNDPDGVSWSWELFPYGVTFSDEEYEELTEQIAADIVAGDFSVKVVHRSETRQVFR